VRAAIDATDAVPLFSYDGYQTFDGVQVSSDGTIYQVVSTGRQPHDLTKIVVISPTSTRPMVFDLTGSAHGELAIDPATGTVYQTLRTADPETGADTTTVVVITPGAPTPVTLSFPGETIRSVLGPNGSFYQVTVQPYEPTLVVISPDGTTVTTATLFGNPTGPVVVGPDGTAYVPLEYLDGDPYPVLGIVAPGSGPDEITYWFPPGSDDFVGGVVFNDGAVYQTVQAENTAVVYDIATEDDVLISAPGEAQGPVVFGPDGAAYLTTVATSPTGTSYGLVTVDRGDAPATGYETSPLVQYPLVFGPDGTAYLTTKTSPSGNTLVLAITDATSGLYHFYDGAPMGPVRFGPDGTPHQVTEIVHPVFGGPGAAINVVPNNGDPVSLPGSVVGMTFGPDGTAYVTTRSVSLGQAFYTVSIVSADGDTDAVGAFGRAAGAPLLGPDGNVYQMIAGVDANDNPQTTVLIVIPEDETSIDARFVDLPGTLVDWAIEDGYVYVTTTVGNGTTNTSTVWLLDAQAEPVAL
jgi:WD40 repeat protein